MLVLLGSLLSGLLYSLAFPRFSFGWVAFVAFIPVLWAVSRTKLSLKAQFGVGLLTGVIPMLILHRWFFALLPWVPWYYLAVLWVAFSLYQACFWGATFWVYGVLGRRWWVFPAAWVVFEWLRTLGPVGSTAGALGMSLVSSAPLLQMASLWGVFGLSFYSALLNSLVLVPGWRYRTIAILSLVAILGWGYYRIASFQPTNQYRSVVLVQGNHPQMDKLSAQSYWDLTDTYSKLSAYSFSTLHPDFVLWPETVTPYFNLTDTRWMSELMAISRAGNGSIVFGTPMVDGGKNYSSMSLITPSGISLVNYHKQQLMPFGEYWPFRSLLLKIGLEKVVGTGDYTPGSGAVVLPLPGLKLGCLICLESLYPSFTRDAVRSGAEVLSVVANNAWFFDSIAADIHFDMAKMRAVEANRFVLQAANTGISGVIDPLGRVVQKSKMDRRQLVFSRFSVGYPKSVYHVLGDWVVWGSFLVLGVGCFVRFLTRIPN